MSSRTDATPADVSRDTGETFLRAEQSGLKLAIIGRTVALVLLGVWLVGSRARDPVRALDYVIVLSVFAALGLVQYALIATRFDRRWLKYVFITIDIAIVSALVATQPLFETAADLPPVMTFRAPLFPYYFVILGVAAFSFSPGMVLWTGIVGALGWLVAFVHAAGGIDGSLNWRAIPPNPTADEVMAVVLHPNFGGLSGRVQEAISLVVVAVLIALVMWRARSTLKRQLEAERDRTTPHWPLRALRAAGGRERHDRRTRDACPDRTRGDRALRRYRGLHRDDRARGCRAHGRGHERLL